MISTFKPAWWLPSRHFQSCYTSIVNYTSKFPQRWEELTLPDGDFVDIVWSGPSDAPLVVILHGLEGSTHSFYVQLMIENLVQRGWQVVAMNYRMCSGRMNRHVYSYNGGETKDIAYLIDVLRQRFPNEPLYALGFSLGGNLLLRYMAAEPLAPIRRAVVVSTPYEMNKSADYLSGFYQRMLLRTMKKKAAYKIKAGMSMPVTLKELKSIKRIPEFDELITAKLYGFESAQQYYEKISCRHLLKDIQHPTLIIHALDDPMIPPDSVPKPEEYSSSITHEVVPHGGHVGFISGAIPWRPEYWLRDQIMNYFM